MRSSINLKSDRAKKTKDSLLVLNHKNNSIGIVDGVNQLGEIICKANSQNNHSDVQFVDDSIDDHSFTEMFSHFYHQLKDPSEFSFFKVTEYEAQQNCGRFTTVYQFSFS